MQTHTLIKTLEVKQLMATLSRKRNNELLDKNDSRRKRIQATKLIDRLQDNALGKLKVELSASRLKSIEILLRKTLPDLATVQIVGDENRPVKMEYTWGTYQTPKQSAKQIKDITPSK